MWLARRRISTRRRPVAGEGGFSLVEGMIVTVLLSGIVLIGQQLLTTLLAAEGYLSVVERTSIKGSEIAYEMAREIQVGRTFLEDDARGRGYLAALDLQGKTPLPAARLPRIAPEEGVRPDTPGTPQTGNVLLLVTSLPPLACVADPSAGETVRIDLHRLVCFYPHETATRLQRSNARARDLRFWRGRAYPSHAAIMAITDTTKRRRVVSELFSRYGHTHAWDPDRSANQAFFAIDGVGTVAATPTPAMVVPPDGLRPPMGRLVHARMQLARTDASAALRRAVYTADPPSSWVPEGFEVKIAGPSGGRQVWLHLVVEGVNNDASSAVTPSTRLVYTGNF